MKRIVVTGGKRMPLLELEVVGTEEDDSDRIEDLTGQLRREVAELDVERVERRRAGSVPAGSKGAGSEIGVLLVQAAPAVIPSLLATAQAWVLRAGQRKVRVKLGEDEIELAGDVSDDDRSRLIEAFVRRHVGD